MDIWNTGYCLVYRLFSDGQEAVIVKKLRLIYTSPNVKMFNQGANAAFTCGMISTWNLNDYWHTEEHFS